MMKLLFDQNISYRIIQLLKTNLETIKNFVNNTEFSDIACLEIE